MGDREKWRWKVRAFFSADIVGSTAFKSDVRGKNGEPTWASTFVEFYEEFPVVVAKGYEKSPTNLHECKNRIRSWKFSGDEILFQVDVTDFRDVIHHVAAFKAALIEYSSLWSTKKVALSLKGTAWLAGFPITNREVSAQNSGPIDFIGPSIDLGFRLTKFSSPRRLVLSADLALMLLDAVQSCDADWDGFHIYMHGCEELKGVTGGRPYPVFWLDMNDGRPDPEEELLGTTKPFIPHKAREYLNSYLAKSSHLQRPFIEGDKDARYGAVPAEFDRLRGQMMSEELNRNYSEDTLPVSDEAGVELPSPQLYFG